MRLDPLIRRLRNPPTLRRIRLALVALGCLAVTIAAVLLFFTDIKRNGDWLLISLAVAVLGMVADWVLPGWEAWPRDEGGDDAS